MSSAAPCRRVRLILRVARAVHPRSGVVFGLPAVPDLRVLLPTPNARGYRRRSNTVHEYPRIQAERRRLHLALAADFAPNGFVNGSSASRWFPALRLAERIPDPCRRGYNPAVC